MKLSKRVNLRIRKSFGSLVLFSQVFSLLAPVVTFAAPQSIQGSDIQNSLETVGTKANRLKTVGSSGVDESTGAFTYSYPISLPKGLMGLEPSITLSYNSQATENSNIGFGWNMAIPYIERTAKYGVDKIYSKNDFVSSLGGELILKTNTTNTYIQKIDDGSYQLYTFSNNIWTLTDRSGNIYTFGTTLDSRLCDNTCSKIQKYYLTEVRDILGNKIKYFYEKKNNVVYPKEIIYTIKKDGTYANKVVFEREERLDKEISYRSGFRTELTDRIKTIRAYTDNVEVVKLELAYTTGQNGTRSLLTAIKESRLGTDNLWSTIPETKFEYETGNQFNSVLSFVNVPINTARVDITGDAKPENVSLDTSDYRFLMLDIQGDYFMDMYRKTYTHLYYGLSLDGQSQLKLNNGDGSFNNLGIDYISLPKTAQTPGPSAWWKEMVADVSDFNGDGLTDIFSENKIYTNVGGSFSVGSSTLNIQLTNLSVDFNGDGLPDIIKDYSSSTNSSVNGKYVYLNNGKNWEPEPEMSFKIPVEQTVKATPASSEVDAGVRFYDVNGDGLPDLVRAYTSSQTEGMSSSINYAPTGVIKELYINTGKGFVKINNPEISGSFVSYSNPSWRVLDTQNFVLEEVGGINKRDILKKITSPLGAKSEIIYKGSVSGNNPKLPINILTVSEIKNTEVNKNLIETTKYTYENGKMYFNKNNVYDRRFAGFQKVTTETGTPTNSKKVIKYFHQGDGDDVATFERGDSFHNIGRVYKEEVYGTSGTVATKYADTYRTYGVYSWDGQIYKYPKLEVATEYDKNGNTFSKATQYEYDLAARLPKLTENFGEVKWDITTGTFTDTGEDYVQTKNIYNTKRPQKLLAEESFDINGKFLDKKLYFYDELPFGYVEKGLLSEERNYSSINNYVKTTYTYHPTGLVASKTENNGAVTTFNYDTNYNLTSTTNALNQTTSTTYNKVLGVQTSNTNPNGKITNTVYDGFGNVKNISQTSPKDDIIKLVVTKNISYTGSGLTETESVYNAGAVYKTSTKIYDSFGRLVRSQNTNTDNSNQTIDVTYNNLGQMTKVSYPYDSNGILSGYFSSNDTNYSYDELGRNISVSQGNLTNFTDYIVNGKITRDNTPDQHKKEYKYNSQGKLASVKEYTNATNLNETKYEWNLLGNLTKLTDAMGNVRNFQYDSEGRLLKQEDLHAPTDNTFGTYSYTYNNNGLLISKKDPSNNVATYEYDLLNRPKKESFGVVTNYVHDTCQNGIGALCEVNNAEYTQKLRYTKAGNISTETKSIDDKIFTQMYEYNDLGQNTKIVLPDSSYITYSYDTNGKQKTASLTRMVNTNGNVVASTTQIVTDAKYNIDGTIKNYTAGNGAKTCYEYSNINGGNVLPRLSKINVTNNGDCGNPTNTNLLFSQELKYNLFGSIIENKEIFGANNFNSGAQSEVLNKYQYDVLQRLTKSERLENNLNIVNNLSYNSIGNILSSDSKNYSYTGADYQNPHAPSVIGGTTMSYDLNGNILSDGKNIYEWNYKNTLKKVVNDKSISEYTYDVSGERIKEVVKVKTNISTSTFAGETLAYSGEEFFTDYANIVSTTSEKYFMSKTAYDEVKSLLNVATATPSLVVDLVNKVYTTKFVTDSCKNILIADKEKCLRETTLKVLYTTTKKEKNISLSFGTLQEIWGVFRGDVKIDAGVYSSKSFTLPFEYSIPGFKYYFSQQNYISDYTGQPWCTLMENPNNNYVCNYIFTKNTIPSYENFVVSDAKFFFTSQNTIPATTTKVSNIINIDLASSTKYATTSTNIYSYAAYSGLVTQWNYNSYVADIKSIITSWNNSTSTHVGLSLRNEPLTPTNQYYNTFGPSATNWPKETLPTIKINYIFTGKLVEYNATNTKVVTDANIENYYSQIKSGIASKELIKELPYISESSYNELVTNKLAKQNKIEMLFALALEANKYVKDTCRLGANLTDTNCQKKEAIKFVASYLYIKHNIKLSANTLEEMYQVYVGNLRIPTSVNLYEKREIGTLLSTASNYNCYLYQYTINCISTHNLSTISNKLLSGNFKYKIGPWFGGAVPVDVLINDEKVISASSSTELKNINLDAYIKKAKDSGNLGTFKIEVRGTFTDWSGIRTEVGEISVKEVAYVNPGNINSQINPLITDSILNEKIYGTLEQQDKNLLGAIYKQKKIASLFGSEKLISKESFAELIALGFTYSDLIIKDMLIDASFAPYGKCQNIVDDTQERNCRKEIFMKYLFAIAKYEYDKDISIYALDELFEVTEGNLFVPNNSEDYKIRNSQIFNLTSTEKTHVMESYYSYSVDTNGTYMTGCQSGSFIPGQLYINNTCDISFTVPGELTARKNEIESATLTLFASQGRGDSYSPGVFNPGQVFLYPVISNSPFSYNGSGIPPASVFHSWNTNPLIVSATENIRLGEATEVNITNVLNAIVKGEVNNAGLRIISTGHNINYTNAGKYQLNVKFAKDAPQNQRQFYVPYIVDTKDELVYVKVLEVLARIDRQLNISDRTILSYDTFKEIENTKYKTTEDIAALFEENEKLQKDDTLHAVWNEIKINGNVGTTTAISREALEELFMVWQGRIQIATSTLVYSSTSTNIFDRRMLENLSVVNGVESLRKIEDSQLVMPTDTNIGFNLSAGETRLVSDDTKGELLMVGLETKEKISEIFNKATLTTPVANLTKDAQMYFFYEYVKNNSNYEFSREALEEIYLIHTNKVLLVINSTTLQNLKETVVLPLQLFRNGVFQRGNCFIGTTAEAGYPTYTCASQIPIVQKVGYKLSKAELLVSGELQHNYYTYYKTVVTIGNATSTNAAGIMDLSAFIDINKDGNFNLKLNNSGSGLNQLMYIGSVSVVRYYEPETRQFQREALGDLVFTSSLDDLETAYYTQLGLPVPTKPIVVEEYVVPPATTTTVYEPTLNKVSTSSTESIYPVANIVPGLISGTTTSITIQATTTKDIVSTSTIMVVSTSTKEVVNSYIDYVEETKQREVATTTLVDIVSTTTREVLVPITTYVISTTTIQKVSTSTTNKIFWIGKHENVVTSTAWDEFKGNTVLATQVLGTTTLTGTKPWVGRNSSNVTSRQRIFIDKLIPNTQSSLIIYTSRNITAQPFYILVASGTAKLSTNSFSIPGAATTVKSATSTHTISFTPQTSSITLELNSKLTSGNHYYYLDAYKITKPEIVYATTTVVSTTSVPVITYATTTEILSTTTKALITSTSTENYTELNPITKYSTTTEVHTIETPTTITSTTTEIITIDKQLDIPNPYNYPYTRNESTGEIIYYISSIQNYTATSSNPLDTPCTLKLLTCRSTRNTVSGILENYKEDHSYLDYYGYTKFYPSAYYEFDSRGIVTINVPFNGKVVATVKYSNTENTNLQEISYIHNSYNSTPVLSTDANASTTQIVKRDVWGDILNNNYDTNAQVPTSFGLTNHKWDEQSELTYAHARFLSNKNKVWLSHDPYSINNFTNGTWLMNPQIQNSYSYASNNPVNMVDPDGQKPTPEEAARMSAQIYINGYEGANLSGGWTYNYAMYGGDNLKMGVYSRTTEGKTEYTIAYRGTTPSWSDIKNDIQQPFGWSADARAAMSQAGKVLDELGSAEVTFTGHSQGGAYAQLSGVRYNKNVMTYNSARPFYGQYGLTLEVIMYANGTKKIEPYKVDGEILGVFNNVFFGASAMPMGGNISLPSQGLYNVTAPSTPGITSNRTTAPVTNSFRTPFQNSFNDHSSKSVLYGVTSKSW